MNSLPTLAPWSRRRWLSAVLAATATVSCRREQVGTKSDPLVLALSPAHGTRKDKVAELEEMLARETGLAVEIRVAPNSEAAVRTAGSVNTDAGLLTLFDYLFARRQYGVVAALRVERSGHSQKHRGEIVVLKSSGITALAGLAHKRIAYVDRYSTTGFVLAANELKSAGVDVDHVFTNSHEAALAALRAGKVDAAATYEGALHDAPKLSVVAHTAFIPNEPVFFRKGLAADLRTKVTRAIERLAGQPSGQAVLSGIADIAGFSPTTDAAYDEAYEIITAAGKSVQDLVPRGWLLANENQRRPGDLAP